MPIVQKFTFKKGNPFAKRTTTKIHPRNPRPSGRMRPPPNKIDPRFRRPTLKELQQLERFPRPPIKQPRRNIKGTVFKMPVNPQRVRVRRETQAFIGFREKSGRII